MKHPRHIIFSILLLFGLQTHVAAASDGAASGNAWADFIEQPGFAGEWGGLRPLLNEHGLDVRIGYSGEAVRTFAGSLQNKKAIYHDNLDITLSLDTEKAGLWQGGTWFVSGLRNHGGDPSATIIGDLQTASNIEAPEQFIVYQAWFEQRFGAGLSVLLGLHDLNSEFYISEYASLFLNSSFGIGPEITVNVPSSIFPKAGLGARIRIQPVETSYIQAAVYDGDPATRGFRAGEGRMWIAETGAHAEGLAAKLGYWQHTADRIYNGRTFSRDFGYYAIADLRLGQWDTGAAGVFVQLGHAPKDRNDVSDYLGFGLHLRGMVPGRHNDELGLAVAQAKTVTGAEKSLEATLRLQLARWLVLQPSYQWIIHPGGDSARSTARVGLLRFEANL